MKITGEELDAEADSKELQAIADLAAALEMHKRVMEQCMRDMQEGMQKKCEYKFTVKRDENKLITELIASPVRAK